MEDNTPLPFRINGDSDDENQGRNFHRFVLSYQVYLGGDLASTWVAKPEVHAEVQDTS